jgi:methylmalonyl-CoA/ethylmalonyl-CoA epimerase
MAKVTRINHIAILVDDLEAPLSFWRDALGMELTHVQDVPAEQAQIAFLPTGESEIELVKPTTDDSGLARYLEKRGPGMHHICLEVDDIHGMLAQLKAKGIQLINEEPRVGREGASMPLCIPRAPME